jgi:hypothetical protein
MRHFSLKGSSGFWKLACRAGALGVLLALHLIATDAEAAPRVGRAVGGLNSVLLSVRPPSGRAAGLELIWSDAIPAGELVRFRILRSAGASVDGPGLESVLACALALLLLGRRRAVRSLGMAALTAVSVWAAAQQFWVPPSQLIGTTQERRFLDASPLSGYNTYRVVAERTMLPELPSNTAGAFVGGANALTLEPGDQLVARAGAALTPDGSTAVAYVSGATSTPSAVFARLDPPAILGTAPLPGTALAGVGPVILDGGAGALFATASGTTSSPEVSLSLLDPATGAVLSSLRVFGRLVAEVGPVPAPDGRHAALLLGKDGGQSSLVLVQTGPFRVTTLDLSGDVQVGLVPTYTPAGDRVTVALAGGTSGTLHVIDALAGSQIGSVALPGQPLARAPAVVDSSGATLYLGARRDSATDAVAQVQLGPPRLRQTIALDGRLLEGLAPALADGDAALIVGVGRKNQTDLVEEFSSLMTPPMRLDRFALPGDLMAGTRPRVSPNTRRAAVLTSGADGSILTLINLHTRTAIGSIGLPGELVAGVGPAFSPDNARAAALTQAGASTRLTGVTSAGPLDSCSAWIDGQLVPELGPAVTGVAGTAFLASSQSPAEDRLTLVRDLAAGRLLVATRSPVSGSRLTSIGFDCGTPQFLLVPGSAYAAATAP